MDIEGWLRSLGLERYEAAFRENEINATVLPNLTAEDLKDLGVGIVGHRRKLLDAIAALRLDANNKLRLAPQCSFVASPYGPRFRSVLGRCLADHPRGPSSRLLALSRQIDNTANH